MDSHVFIRPIEPPPVLRNRKAPTGDEICESCGSIGTGKSLIKGNIGTEIVLWLLFLVPGVCYSVWRLTTRRHGCRECGGNMLRVGTPRGLQLWSQYHGTR
jgi:hypothetical protein